MMSSLRTFLQELKRRKVYAVAVVYAVVGWGVTTGAQFLFEEALGLPEVAWHAVAGLIILGFPIALVLAWAYEIRPEGQAVSAHQDAGSVEAPGRAVAVEAAAPRRSIAVLPFADMSPGRDHEFFCDGLSEALINAFAGLTELKVVARTSAFSFKGKDVDVREIGPKLGVGTVLEGSVQVAGNRLRITAQLIDVSNGYHLWSKRFDRTMDDVFAIQDEISLAIADRLELRLGDEEKGRLVRRHTDDSEAFKHYLMGRHFYNKRTKEGFDRAVEHFESALQRDPGFALPLAGLADTYLAHGFYEFMPLTEAWDQARAYAVRAIEIDDGVGAAHTSLAFHLSHFDYDWDGAMRAHRRALELGPSDAENHHHYAHFLAYLARYDDAVVEMRRALELEPLSVNLLACLGQVQYLARRTEAAVAQLEEAVKLDPSFPLQYWFLGKAYLQAGRHEQAIEALTEAATHPSVIVMAKSALGYAFATSGNPRKAREIIEELLELANTGPVDPVLIAVVHVGLQELDQAVGRLYEAFEERSMHLPMIGVESYFDALRTHPRFQELVDRIGLSGPAFSLLSGRPSDDPSSPREESV